jgi:hypothetical protein
MPNNEKNNHICHRDEKVTFAAISLSKNITIIRDAGLVI